MAQLRSGKGKQRNECYAAALDRPAMHCDGYADQG
nr:MAG TPA: hypothetical protein [Caudoviricetes sp.]